jgi:hypothetical protein
MIGVGDTVLSVSGLTSPHAFVTILDNNSVIGTTAADSYGSYIKDFSAFTPGIHHLSVYARDEADRLTDRVDQEVSVAEHFQTNVSIFLPPTFSVTNPMVVRGEHVQLSGSTLANGIVTITLDDTTNFQVQANTQGNWFYELDTTSLSVGSHWLYAIATEASSGHQSYPAAKRSVTVTAKTAPFIPGPTIPVVTPPTQQPPPPVITHPTPGSTVTDNQLIVRGTAHPGTQIELFNRDRSIGSTFTDRYGNWYVTITLTELEYLIKARACWHMLCSDFSEGVRFFYHPPGDVGGFRAYLEQSRYMTQTGEPITIRLHIEGGRGPYRVEITWCGGGQETLSTTQSELALSHTYRKADACIGRITVEEQGGRSVNLSFSVLVAGSVAFPWLWLFLLLFLILLLLFLIRKHQNKKRNHNYASKLQL